MAQTATRGAAPLYRDIAERTQGELYIGVVGPVRAGKSTFITQFMEKLVLPLIPPGATALWMTCRKAARARRS